MVWIILTLVFLLTTIVLTVPLVRREIRIRKYRDEYRSEDTKMELVYVDRLGNKWYQYKNGLNLPPKRAIRAEIATRMATLCLTAEMFDQYIELIRKACNKGDLAKVCGLVDRMAERRTLPAEENTLRNLCDAYFLIEGENPKAPSAYYFEKKKDAWEKDPDCYSFFLFKAFSTMRVIKGLSETDLMEFLLHQAAQDTPIRR